jgi:acyl-CoA dehydrogenase
MWPIALLLALVLAVALLYVGRTWLAWVLAGAPLLLLWLVQGGHNSWFAWTVAVLFTVLAVLTGHVGWRKRVLSPLVMKLIAPILPRMSPTEKAALDAGTVWWDADLFSGAPDWKKLAAFKSKPLSPREKAFLDGPVEELCEMLDEHAIERDGDLPPEVWKFIRAKGFLGMIIPESYGGLGFSAFAHAAVVTKLSSRSVAASVTVMVPNSLGPAELLLHYGTEEQKNFWLPRLASGEELPCFALTEPGAGSDAASLTSRGVVGRGHWKGQEVLGMRLTFDKRYITMAPVATVIGLAFQLEDPERLLGGEEHLGITCALIPKDVAGIEIGQRHDPLGVAFMNGPIHGRDVFVPLDMIIGGRVNAGRGWQMLMQSLAAGRGISLPAMAVGASQVAARTVGAYATVREQFGLPIGRFEGVQERIARIGGLNYTMDAARRLTAASIDAGEQPSVVTAIVKCYLTEGMRTVVNDAMDVVGGAGICRGPRNILAGAYAAVPIGITVEGANILTRSMIVFGQGALRCHPFAKDEVRAVETKDLDLFDRAFFGHVGFVFQNAARAFVLGATGGLVAGNTLGGDAGRYAKRLSRLSATFAFLADVAMGTLGGSLKFKERLTARLADALAWQYLASCALKRFIDDGQPERDRVFFRWSMEYACREVQNALDGFLRNLPMRPVAWLLRPLVFPLGLRHRGPSDHLEGQVARALLDGGEAREAHTDSVFVPSADELGLGLLEEAHRAAVEALGVQRKLRAAVQDKRIERRPAATLPQRALEAGLLTAQDLEALQRAASLRAEAVAVDSFEKRHLARASA